MEIKEISTEKPKIEKKTAISKVDNRVKTKVKFC